jgi:hypothetical protein
MSQTWVYLAVAALHLPGIGLLAFLLHHLAASDPPEPVPAAPPPDGPFSDWRWRPRPRPRPGRGQRGSGAASASAARGTMRGS